MVYDALWVGEALLWFAPLLPNRANERVQFHPSEIGEPYDEEQTPHYTAPDMDTEALFWKQQLPPLINLCLDAGRSGTSVDDGSIASCFLASLGQFVATRRASIEALFVCVCWIRSVAGLQGRGDLGRNVSLVLNHRWDLEHRLCKGPLKVHECEQDESFNTVIDKTIKKLGASEAKSWVLRANPLLASFVLLDHQFEYLRVGSEALFNSPRLSAFAHLYCAFRHFQLIEANVLCEHMLCAHGQATFPRTRSTPEPGSFLDTYLRNSDGLVGTLAHRMRRSRDPVERSFKRSRGLFTFTDLSNVARIVKARDFSMLPAGIAKSTSWKTLLTAVSGLCSQELFDSRVLSRDLVRLQGDLQKVFSFMCKTVTCEAEYKAMLSSLTPRSCDYDAITCANEAAVVERLLSQVDAMTFDTCEDLSRAVSWDSEHPYAPLFQVCAKMREVWHRSDPVEQEKTFFTFPTAPNWVAIEFAEMEPLLELEHETASDAFVRLFRLMESSHDPLSDYQLQVIKRTTVAFPDVLKMQAEVRTSRLCTILHQAAAGPARDHRLVEWLVQMGALRCQPSIGDGRGCCELAVHSAARAGLVDMALLLLEAGNLRDINMVTGDRRESLAHIAAQNDDYALLCALVYHGAVMTSKDVAGKDAYDYIEYKYLKRQLLALQRDLEARLPHPVPAEAQYETTETGTEKVPRADRVSEDVRQRDEVRVEPVEANVCADASKSISPDVSTNIDQADSSNENVSRNVIAQSLGSRDRIEHLAEALNTLKRSHQTSQDEREASILSALSIVYSIQAGIRNFTSPKRSFQYSTAVVVREATQAAQTLFLLNKFHRQLPPPPHNLPRHAYWAIDVDEQSLSNWEKLRLRCGSSLHIHEFIIFAASTADLLARCRRVAQAKEVLELAERRLLKWKHRNLSFRPMLELLFETRKRAGLELTVGSTLEAQRQFEWYSPLEAAEYEVLDRMYGFNCYCVIKCIERLPPGDRRIEPLEQYGRSLPQEATVVIVGNDIVLGAESSELLSRSIAQMLGILKRSGFRYRKNPVQTKTLKIMGFEFSATEIVRIDGARA